MQDKLLALLAGRRGHFLMESGYHSEQWFELEPLLADEARLKPFVSELARRLARHEVDAVCGPMTGGAKLAERIAAELNVEYFFTERFVPANPRGLFPVEYRLPLTQRAHAQGKKIALVDDAVSAGSAVRGTARDLQACGAKPVVMGALFVFGAAAFHFAAEQGLVLEAIARMPLGLWPPEACPLCRAGVTLEHVSES